MFKRERHQAIVELLHLFNSDILTQAKCYFGGGTAISLALNEYRESVDIDFLCSDSDGYRFLRNITTDNIDELFTGPVKYLRDVRKDQYKIYTIIESNNIPIKLEIVREARTEITGEYNSKFRVPTLSQEDLFTQKLLANADRGLDRATMSRDIIDLAMMITYWGGIPEKSWQKAEQAYGNQVAHYYAKSISLIHDKAHLSECIKKMAIDSYLEQEIPSILRSSLQELEYKGIKFPEIELPNINQMTY